MPYYNFYFHIGLSQKNMLHLKPYCILNKYSFLSLTPWRTGCNSYLNPQRPAFFCSLYSEYLSSVLWSLSFLTTPCSCANLKPSSLRTETDKTRGRAKACRQSEATHSSALSPSTGSPDCIYSLCRQYHPLSLASLLFLTLYVVVWIQMVEFIF